jgi:hypothetical protein
MLPIVGDANVRVFRNLEKATHCDGQLKPAQAIEAGQTVYDSSVRHEFSGQFAGSLLDAGNSGSNSLYDFSMRHNRLLTLGKIFLLHRSRYCKKEF